MLWNLHVYIRNAKLSNIRMIWMNLTAFEAFTDFVFWFMFLRYKKLNVYLGMLPWTYLHYLWIIKTFKICLCNKFCESASSFLCSNLESTIYHHYFILTIFQNVTLFAVSRNCFAVESLANGLVGFLCSIIWDEIILKIQEHYFPKVV